MEIRPLTEAEQKCAYTQSMQIKGQTGYIGHLRGDFDRDGNGFLTSWDDHRKHLKTDEFQVELDDVINALRSGEYGLLQNRSAMRHYVARYPESSFEGNDCTEYGFRAETEKYAFLIRYDPMEGDYNFNFYCYVKEWLDSHIKSAEKGIRFIDSSYNELFRIADGEKIVITDAAGEKSERICRYIDEYHTEVGDNLFHICQFAELMERNGSSYEPKQTEQPEKQQEAVKHEKEDSKQMEEQKELVDDALRLASDMDAFAWDYDPYAYGDAVSDREQAVQELYGWILEGTIQPAVDWLNDIIEDCEIPEYVENAKKLVERLEAFRKPLELEHSLPYLSPYSGETQVMLDIQQYANNGRIAISLITNEEGYPELFGCLTVNIDEPAPDYCGYLDTNNLSNAEKFVTENGLGEFTGFTGGSGYCKYPLYLFNVDKLRELCPEQMAAYEHSIGADVKKPEKEKSR